MNDNVIDFVAEKQRIDQELIDFKKREVDCSCDHYDMFHRAAANEHGERPCLYRFASGKECVCENFTKQDGEVNV